MVLSWSHGRFDRSRANDRDGLSLLTRHLWRTFACEPSGQPVFSASVPEVLHYVFESGVKRKLWAGKHNNLST